MQKNFWICIQNFVEFLKCRRGIQIRRINFFDRINLIDQINNKNTINIDDGLT